MELEKLISLTLYFGSLTNLYEEHNPFDQIFNFFEL